MKSNTFGQTHPFTRTVPRSHFYLEHDLATCRPSPASEDGCVLLYETNMWMQTK